MSTPNVHAGGSISGPGGVRSERDARLRRGASSLAAVWLVVLSLLFVSARAAAQEIRFTSENDFLTNNPTNDDLYTASFELEFRRGPYTIGFRENAFTDREADLRFDETFVTVERMFRLPDDWQLTAEAGVVHIGHGLFGEDLQNAIHRLLGNSEVDYEYLDALVRPTASVVADRMFWPTPRLAVGPRFELFAARGLRSHGVAALQMAWEPNVPFELHVVAGGRWSDASLPALQPHTEQFAQVVRVGAVLWDRVLLAWTYNDYGDRREHVSIGYKFGFGKRRQGDGD